jgi:hypothetical protein
MLLAPSKQKFYNKAPVCYLQSIADQGYSVVANNGLITDLEITAESLFNHAHNDTFVNNPAGTMKAFK